MLKGRTGDSGVVVVVDRPDGVEGGEGTHLFGNEVEIAFWGGNSENGVQYCQRPCSGARHDRLYTRPQHGLSSCRSFIIVLHVI